ncbi:MAG: GGDEF domain-containing protein [Coriobacteriia bacterium]|nr:GGDEF domain-containing protein [Coriobacteriia bacterium]
MGQRRFAKTLARGAVVAWRDQPTQYDIEALRANIERVGLVIRVRWVVVVALGFFGGLVAVVYGSAAGIEELLLNARIPVAALGFVVAYNTLYHLTYRRVGNVAYLNQAQLLFDMMVGAVLIYYSGGVYSWFSAMYLLFILEGAFILEQRSHVWVLAGAASALYGAIIFGVYFGWLPHVAVPFVRNDLQSDLTYILMRYLWEVALYGGAATVGLLMMRTIRERESELNECSFIDDLTGLYNRQYFHRVLGTEIERAQRNGTSVGLLLADVNGFATINRTFGVDVGDGILAAVADRLREVVSAEAGEAGCHVTTACRVGGEELALIMPEMRRSEYDLPALGERMTSIAEQFRAAVERVRVSGISVTASVGMAIGPEHGRSADALLDTADRMLSRAAHAGGNTVRTSWADAEQATDDD